MTDNKETYLGDGLYASFDGWQICLRASRTLLGESHEVFLEPAVWANLVEYVASLSPREHSAWAGDESTQDYSSTVPPGSTS